MHVYFKCFLIGIHMTVFWPISMWNISKTYRFFDSLLKPFVHWASSSWHFLDPFVHRQKVKHIPHLGIVTVIAVAIGTTFCYADDIERSKLRTLFLLHSKLKFLCRVSSVIVHSDRKPVLFRKLKCSSISCGGDYLMRESGAERNFTFNHKYSEVLLLPKHRRIF